jgi:hypothetical protein
MTLTAPVDDLTLSAEGYPWYLYIPSLEVRVSPHLPVLGQDLIWLSVSGAGDPEPRHFGYIV